MISANELLGNKRRRLSKKEFANIQKELENYTNKKYPELGITKLYNKDLKEFKSKKGKLIDILDNLFSLNLSKDEFINYLENFNIKLYKRAKSFGVIYENKKYRLKTLGYLEKFEALKDSFKKEEKTKVELNENEAKIEKRREELKRARSKSKARQKQR